MTGLVSESKARCLENRRLLADSRFLVASSRRLLNPAWVIAGASDGIDLHVTVRERLVSGWLFPAPHKVWAGKGTGHICVICGTSIAPSEIENEVVGPTTVWAHLPCYSIWHQESETHNGSTGTDGTDYLADLRQIVRLRFANGMLPVRRKPSGTRLTRLRSCGCAPPRKSPGGSSHHPTPSRSPTPG